MNLPNDPNDLYKTEHDAPDTDWYGGKAKRKNSDPARNERLRALAAIVVALAIIVAGCAVGSIMIRDSFSQLSVASAATSSVEPPTQIAIAPIPLPTSTPAPITATPIPAIVQQSMRVGRFDEWGRLSGWLTPPSSPGYTYRGLTLTAGSDPRLYAAHTRGLGIAGCDPNEGYLRLDGAPQPLGDAGRIISPKALLFIQNESQDYAVVLGAQCQKRTFGIFLFTRQDDRWNIADEFPIIGGDALFAVGARVYVTLSGFAGGDEQPHLIALEIAPGEPPPRLKQIGEYLPDRADVVYRSAIYHENVGVAYIRSEAGMESIQIAPLDSLIAAESRQPVHPGKSIMLTFGITELAFTPGGALLALDRRGRRILLINDELTGYTQIKLQGIIPYSFRVDENNHFLVAGYPMTPP